MVALQQPFDVRSVQPRGSFDTIPEGWYPAIMVSSQQKPTQANDGGYIECVYEIIDGQYKGRNMWDRLNLWNSNQKAVEIAYGTLSAIGWCVGVFNVQDTQQLHNIPLLINVVQRKNERDGGMTNDIKGYKNIQGAEPWKAEGGGSQQPQQPPQGSWGQPPQQPPQQQPAQPQGGWQPPQQPQQQPAQAGWQPNGGQQPPQQPQAAPQQGPAPWGGGQPQQAPQQPAQQPPQQPQGGGGWQQGQPGPAPWGGQQ